MKILLLFGAILFLLGLFNGAIVRYFKNSRMGLSAHLAGVQNGLVLLIFGLIWPHLSLTSGTLVIFSFLSIYSMYAIWLSLFLAAIWGTSSATPIAGAGYSGNKVQEQIVNIFLYSGSLAIIIATVQVIKGLLL